MPKKIKAAKLPSPCVDVCKFKREGHCIGCSMTKAQKKLYKKLKDAELQAAFIEMLEYQQAQLGRYDAWPILYQKKVDKKRGKAAKKAA